MSDQSGIPPMFRVEFVPITMLLAPPKAVFRPFAGPANGDPSAYVAQAGGAKKNVALLIREGSRWFYWFHMKGKWLGGDSHYAHLDHAKARVKEDIAALV